MDFNPTAKRIFSGLFILVALGALAVIIAGAVVEGNQLIVRFLTALVIAALGIYVVSDLRLQGARGERFDDLSGEAGFPGDTDVFSDPMAVGSDAATLAGSTNQQITLTGSAVGVAEQAPVGAPEVNVAPMQRPAQRAGGFNWPLSGEHEAVKVSPNIIAPLLEENLGNDGVGEGDDPFSMGVGLGSDGREDVVVDDYADDLVELAAKFNDTDRQRVLDADSPGLVNAEQQIELSAAVLPGSSQTGDESVRPVGHDSSPDSAPPTVAPKELGIEGSNIERSRLVEVEGPFSLADDKTDDDAESHAKQSQSLPESTRDSQSDTETQMIDLRTEIESTDALNGSSPEHVRAAKRDDDAVSLAIRAGEAKVIETLIEQGMLSTNGEITDRDVRTMVYVAFTSHELRKLIRAGGNPADPSSAIDLGPVELFDETLHAPAPKRLYSASD